MVLVFFFLFTGENGQSDRSNLPGGINEDQEAPESAEKETINHLMLLSENDDQDDQDDQDDHLPLIKRKRTKIRQQTNRLKLLRENFLKRPTFDDDGGEPYDVKPIAEWIPDSPPKLAPPPPVFDTESDSDGSDYDWNNQEKALEIDKAGERLAAYIPMEYKKLMNFMGVLSSASPMLVLQKRLTKGDVEERRNRLLIPQRKIRGNFLDVEEEEKLNVGKWWRVEIVEPDCTVSLVTLSKWETGMGPAYVLITEWSGLVERNELKEGDLMQLWSFRAGGLGGHGRLCLMLLEISEGDEGGEGGRRRGTNLCP